MYTHRCELYFLHHDKAKGALRPVSGVPARWADELSRAKLPSKSDRIYRKIEFILYLYVFF